MEAAATPLPSEETTPPVTNMYFGPVRKVARIPPLESAYNKLWMGKARVSNSDLPLAENIFAASDFLVPGAKFWSGGRI